MMRNTGASLRASILWLGCLLCGSAPLCADVLITEILYHPPGDDPLIEFVEVWSSATADVDLSGWKLSGDVTFDFPAGSKLGPDSRAIIARDLEHFGAAYGKDVPVAGAYKGSLKSSGGELRLLDSKGVVADSVAFSKKAPWPAGADGNGSSLERLCPGMPAVDPGRWAPSPPPLPDEPPGTPGRPCAAWSAYPPPEVSQVEWSPKSPRAGEPIRVEAFVRHGEPLAAVEVAYRIAREGEESEEKRVAMERAPQKGGLHSATIPGEESLRLVRFRIVARDAAGVEASAPSPNDLRPTYTLFVQPAADPGKIPQAYLFHVSPEEANEAQMRPSRGRGGPMGNGGIDRAALERSFGLAGLWCALFADEATSIETLEKLRPVLRAEEQKRKEAIRSILRSPNLRETARAGFSKEISEADGRLEKSMASILSPRAVKRAMTARKDSMRGGRGGFGIEPFVKESSGLEPTTYFAATQLDLDSKVLAAVREAYLGLKKSEKSLVEKVMKSMQEGADPFSLMQESVGSLSEKVFVELGNPLGETERQKLSRWKASNNRASPFGMPGGNGGAERAPRGNTALCVVDPNGQIDVYDYIQAPLRSGGFKVKHHGDRKLRFVDPYTSAETHIRTANLVYEYEPRFILAETLAYELYRRCGVPTPVSGHMRLWVDGSAQGHFLLVEQLNRSFLRRNQRDDEGNLYKLLWYGTGVVGQHEKKTNVQGGHEDLLEVLGLVEKTSGEEQWKNIESRFNVDEVIGYFAASLCLSNWDGFFNNYFAYHDSKGTGKWEIYPWDEDKTWGFYDGLSRGDVFIDMPLDYGMSSSAPPGGQPQQERGRFRGFAPGAPWWRPPGYFSGPILANETVRARYYLRVREVLEKIYTEEVFTPIIAALEERLLPEVRARAQALHLDADREVATFREDLESLRKHLAGRRSFLLSQKELKGS